MTVYDGHLGHVSLHLIEWARENNIILFVLPPHTSHILQPMDLGCFGPFETIYQQEVHKFIRSGRNITRYDVCNLACKAYEKALSPSNVRSAFKKSSIFPNNPNAVEIESTLPSLVFEGQKQAKSVENDGKDRSEKNDTSEIQEEVSTSKETSEQGELEITSKETSEQKLTNNNRFFSTSVEARFLNHL